MFGLLWAVPKEACCFRVGHCLRWKRKLFWWKRKLFGKVWKRKKKKSVFNERMTVKNSTLLLVYKQIFPVFCFKRRSRVWLLNATVYCFPYLWCCELKSMLSVVSTSFWSAKILSRWKSGIVRVPRGCCGNRVCKNRTYLIIYYFEREDGNLEFECIVNG